MPNDLLRAQHLLDLDRDREAEILLRNLLTADPENSRILRLLALALIGQNRDAEAVPVARIAVSTDPENEHGHRLLAIALAHSGEPDAAVLAARAAVRLAPEMWQTHYTLGTSLLKVRHPPVRDALDCANEAVRLAPHESQPHNLAGLCLDRLTLHDEAVRAFNEAVRLDPTNAMAISNLAAVSMEGGRLRAATRLLTSGLSISPQTQALQQNYDALLFRLIRRLFWALIALGIVLAILAGAQAPYVARVFTVLVLLTIYAAATRAVTKHLPRGAHLWARGLLRRTKGLRRATVVFFVLLNLGVVAMGIAPREAALDIGLGLLVLGRLLGIAVIIGGAVAGIAARLRAWRKR